MHGPALAYQPGGDGEDGCADRQVDEEDPRPAQVRREHATEQHTDGATDAGGCAPDAEGDVPLTPLAEGGDDDRKRSRREQSAAKALQPPGDDQRAFRPGEPGEQRAEREHSDACHEQPPASEQVGKSAAQQQHSAEQDRVGGDHPLQAVLGEVKVVLDRRQRDVHDCDVDDDHELRGNGHRENKPASALRLGSDSRFHGSSSHVGFEKATNRWRSRGQSVSELGTPPLAGAPFGRLRRLERADDHATSSS